MKTLHKRTLSLALTMAFALLLTFAAAASAQGGPPNPGNGNRGSVPPAPLTQAEIDALNAVLQDEYHAWAVYDQVIADFGQIAPFVQIQRAEAQHAAVVERLFDRYGLALPANEWADADFASFESVEAACAAGVEAEIANADLYVQALASTDKRDLTNVFTNLQAASLENHLPALEACDTTATPIGSGPHNGQGQQGGWGQGYARNNNQPNPDDCLNPDGPQYDQRRAGGRAGRGGRR